MGGRDLTQRDLGSVGEEVEVSDHRVAQHVLLFFDRER